MSTINRKAPDKGNRSTYAQAASNLPAAAPTVVPRSNCVSITIPGNVQREQVIVALMDQYPALLGSMLLQQDRARIIQLPQNADASELIAKGLKINNVECKVRALHNSSKGNIIQCRVTPYFSTDGGVELLQSALTDIGTILEHKVEEVGNTGCPTGNFDFVIALKDADYLPPSRIRIDRPDWTEHLRLTVLHHTRFCHYCRSASHTRAHCKEAPICVTCKKTNSHQAKYCPERTKPVASPELAATAAAAAAAAALIQQTSDNAETSPRKRSRHEASDSGTPPASASPSVGPSPSPSGSAAPAGGHNANSHSQETAATSAGTTSAPVGTPAQKTASRSGNTPRSTSSPSTPAAKPVQKETRTVTRRASRLQNEGPNETEQTSSPGTTHVPNDPAPSSALPPGVDDQMDQDDC